MNDNVNITGGAQLDDFLQSLPAKVEKNIMRSALRAGGNVIRDEGRANVPVKLGNLRKSIRVSTGAKGGQVFASVKVGSKKAWYWRFIEFGTLPHVIKPKNAGALAVTGHVVEEIDHPGAQAKPFFRPAFDNKATAAVAAVANQVRKRLTAVGLNTPAPEEP